MRAAVVIVALGSAGCASLLSINATAVESDVDGDGVPDTLDNCPMNFNPGQEDTNGDGIGDACQPAPQFDEDGDGIADGVDKCPGTAGVDQTDSDHDGVGDLCDLAVNTTMLHQGRLLFDGFNGASPNVAWAFSNQPWVPVAGAIAPNDPTDPNEHMTLAATTLTGSVTGSWYVQVGLTVPLVPDDTSVDSNAGATFTSLIHVGVGPDQLGTFTCGVIFDHVLGAWRIEATSPLFMGRDNVVLEGVNDVTAGAVISVRASFTSSATAGLECELVGGEVLPVLFDANMASAQGLSFVTNTRASFTYVDVVR